MKEISTPVTIIIATTAEEKRRDDIRRAVQSIRSASEGKVKILVYVNGTIFSQDICDELMNQSDIEYHYDQVGSFPLAIYNARKLVTTPFFGFLDDDDELLTHSIDYRLAKFHEDSSLDLVVGNGIRSTTADRVIDGSLLTLYQNDPLRSLTESGKNWLASCAGLFKTQSFDSDFFADYAKYSEWTYMAYRIALSKKVSFIPELTYRINQTQGSLSASLQYTEGQYLCAMKILSLDLPSDVRKHVQNKATDFAHDVASKALHERRTSLAFSYHLKSLGSLSGFKKYIAFSRYFLYYRKGFSYFD